MVFVDYSRGTDRLIRRRVPGYEAGQEVKPFKFIRLILATWYLAYSFTSTSGPFNVFKNIREQFPLGGLTNCIICLSPYIALGLMLTKPFKIVLNVFAVAGGAVLLHGYTGWRVNY